jgi:hypothetical protein
MFFFFDLGFLWLYVLICHKPNWICNRFGDIEKAVTTLMMDSISISIVIIFFQTFELTLRSLNPIVTNIVYPFGKLSAYLSKKIDNEITYLSNLFEKVVIDSLITTLDNTFFYPINKMYMDWIEYMDSIEPEVLILLSIFTPMLAWIDKRKKWIETRILFIEYLKKFNKKIWQW